MQELQHSETKQIKDILLNGIDQTSITLRAHTLLKWLKNAKKKVVEIKKISKNKDLSSDVTVISKENEYLKKKS
jgi:hypothetical protein